MMGNEGDVMECDRALKEVAEVLPAELKNQLVGRTDLKRIEELRLRRGYPLSVTIANAEITVGERLITEADLRTVLENASQASVHTVLDQTRSGFVTLRGGHRIGLCGTVGIEHGEIRSMRYLSSLAIRVARSVEGQADRLLPKLLINGTVPNIIVLGPPGSGKTTLLRELVRVISDSVGLRVGVADERGEIGALWQGEAQFHLGKHTDVLDGCPKGIAVPILLRGMNPQVIAVDEITHPADVEAVRNAVGCGVSILATAHGRSMLDLKRRPVYRPLIEEKVFERIVILHHEGGARSMRVEMSVC